MNAQTRITKLEKLKVQGNGQSNLERWIESEAVLTGVAQDIRRAAIAKGEPEPEGEALKAEILRVIHAVRTMGVYDL